MAIIFVFGLRRSGSTALWEVMRQNKDWLCLDEPFNPNLAELPLENHKGTRTEFISIFKENKILFKKKFSPILPNEEINEELTIKQKEYLSWLVSLNENIIIDTVRCSFKMDAVQSILPSNTIYIHLHRNPIAWISSHLLPTGKKTWKGKLFNYYRVLSFWRRKGYYNNYQYEDIINEIYLNKNYYNKVRLFSPILADNSLLPAVLKLMIFWNFAYQVSENSCINNSNFISVSFENFCCHPQEIIDKTCQIIGHPMPILNYSNIHSASKGYSPLDHRWLTVAKKAGITLHE